MGLVKITQAKDGAEAESASLKTKCDGLGLETELTVKTDRLAGVEAELQATEQSLAGVSGELGQVRGEVARLQEEQEQGSEARRGLEEGREELEKVKNALEIQRTNYLNKDAELASAKDRSSALQLQWSEAEGALKTEVAELQGDLEDRIRQLGLAGDQIGLLRAELSELRAELEGQQEICREHSSALARSGEQLAGANSMVETTVTRVGELEGRLVGLQEEKAGAEAQAQVA